MFLFFSLQALKVIKLNDLGKEQESGNMEFLS